MEISREVNCGLLRGDDVPGKTLVATLGSEPQVVTLTLHLLEARGETIGEIRVVHTAADSGPVGRAVKVLEGAIEPTRLRMVPVIDGDVPVQDVSTDADNRAVFSTLYREIRALKEQGRSIHFSVAGGRKPMAVYGMTVAQLLFDPEDRLWHLISAGSVFDEKRLWPQAGDDIHLISIPVVQWSIVKPIMTRVGRMPDPWDALTQQNEMRRWDAFSRRRDFIQHRLTEAEREVVSALVLEGLDNAGIAKRLFKSEKTVANQLYSIYEKMGEYLGYREDIRVDRGLVIAELAPYFTMRGDLP